MSSAQTLEGPNIHFEMQNLATYRSKRIVNWYVGSHDKLFPPEEALLARYRATLTDKKILDIGVGGGRTTFYLSKLTSEYVGIDYSPEMIAGCRQKYPHLRFEECDARDLSPFTDESLDAAVFSWNGLDYVNHENRMLVLKEVYRVLKPEGLFIFSSHNRDFPGTRNWIESTKNPLKLPAKLLRFYLAEIRHQFLRKNEIHTEEYSILNDAAHEYKLMTYYISPAKQIEQLRRLGFNGPTELFDAEGHLMESPESTGEYVYYCVRKLMDKI